MTTVSPATRRPPAPASPAGDEADPVVRHAAGPAHAAKRTEPGPERLRREKVLVVVVLVVMLAATLGVLAMQWLTAAPASSGAVSVTSGGVPT